MKKPNTPFPVTAYAGPEYFCDREVELERLMDNINGGNSTTLVALRRLGKTALIRHLFHHLQGKYYTIYLDILPTESLGDMLNQLSTALASVYEEKTSFGKKVWSAIKSLRPVISYDPLSGAPLVSIKSTPEESRQTIAEILQLLESQDKPVVIAIDEFQQILEYPEKQTDAWLRAMFQQLNNVSFIFSGSQQHLMSELFANPGRPFYRSTQFLKIGKLEEEVYREFIVKQFRDHSRSISEKTVTEILVWAERHTYYVQLLCNRLFLAKENLVTSGDWKEEASRILKEQEFVFYGYRDVLTRPQWELLKALAVTGKVYHPTSSDFIARFNLGNSANVLRSLNSLQKKDIVYQEIDPDGNSYYGLYDLLFARWAGKAGN